MIRTAIVAVLCFATVPVAAEETLASEEPSQKQPPRVTVQAGKLWAKPEEIPDSIEDKNPHEVKVFFEPVPGEKHEVARYTVNPKERKLPEWVCADWKNYHFHILVKIPNHASIVVFRDGEPLLNVSTSLTYQPPPRNPMDPEVMRTRLDNLEKRQKVSTAIRIQTQNAIFKRVEKHWLDANCTLEENEWGITNDWVYRELEFDFIEAQYPFDLEGYSRPKAEEFFSKWQSGDRLFSYGTPDYLRVHNEQGFLIVRGCRVIAKYGFLHAGPMWTTQE